MFVVSPGRVNPMGFDAQMTIMSLQLLSRYLLFEMMPPISDMEARIGPMSIDGPSRRVAPRALVKRMARSKLVERSAPGTPHQNVLTMTEAGPYSAMDLFIFAPISSSA